MNAALQLRIDDRLPTPAMPWRQKIKTIVQEMGKMEQVECPLRHHFLPGLYIREIFMPAGSVVIGKIHRTRHFNIIQSGHVSLVDESGTTDLFGPCTFVSEAGVQKTLYIHTDCTWSCIHLTHNKDMESLEDELIEPDNYPVFDRTTERAAISHASSHNNFLEHKSWHGQQ
jgi:hypothetical protein